jgi:hypothetical protein
LWDTWCSWAALSAIVLLGCGFLLFAYYNRRKGATALHWVEAACSSKASVLDIDGGRQQLHARFGFSAHWFDNARVTILLRRPIRSVVCRYLAQTETLTFGDLDCSAFRRCVPSSLNCRSATASCGPNPELVSVCPEACHSHYPQPLDPGTLPGGQHLMTARGPT